ncbi:MAG: flagellar biosynthesis protein FlhF [Piscirickettsiaceae bacterium CG_4_9_14_3_um_filter_43_564]|nr:flagellar biosynthesis protein FlhF [Thiomicrospira sp.]OIP94985.1 MAG: flagellar biosynthesis protein FlhF [Thiomicrospira sp. CG2_30_44_34]PIQ04952.1 MAG: flagellar biosynthesis protein FlhF [Piscirickettsiaceae bacterium CG18_big_fil_WC_8_21_14_2_50_44_103]PIU38227.1 MAG: flagellar biosynthesis protein FlhF [Piscirickettsiaceae bacterium CG07_land_8_20_14_0_80_44_28]PIW57322.1 MAG: flagellar biosynthesis protein FlhF [Piscirickettsiaceae bacterium CG12_big_fil_rev_8_21_14_0_65_44_934]PIW
MKLKRYLAPTMRKAMILVRDELGDDAVIMSTRNTPDGVELVAAIDPEAQQYKEASQLSTTRSSYVSSELSSDAGMRGHGEMAKMADELKAVKQLLENQLSGLAWNQTENQDPNKIALIKRLVKIGIGWDLAQKLVSKVDAKNDQAWREILAHIELMVPIDEKDIIESGGTIALVGPTGVGKTTTIAKIASRFVMRNSPNQIALVTTDCYKIGAQAQLKTFAELMGVPVHVVSSDGEMLSLLSALASKKLILIDTAGISQKDIRLSQQLTKQRAGVTHIRNYLVISAATQLSVMNDIVKSFGEVGLKGCILTKVDEALQLGNVLTVLIEHQLSLSYLSGGQRVPEDLEPVRVRDLLDKALVLGQQNTSEHHEDAFRLGMGKEMSDAQ